MRGFLFYPLFLVVYQSSTIYGLQNVALGKPATMSSTYGATSADLGVDGNTNQIFSGQSCFHTNSEFEPYWTVDLGGMYAIKYVKIYNRQDCCDARANNLQLLIGDSIDTLTAVGEEAVVDSTEMFSVNSDVGSRFVRLKINGRTDYLHLCEVEVFADKVFENVALGATVFMSAIYGNFPATLGIDGNRDSNFNGGTCFHTQSVSKAFWRADLGSEMNIAYIKLFNRMDCCTNRADTLDVKLGNDLAGLVVVDNIPVFSETHTTTLNPGISARYVQLQLNKLSPEYLHLCEVEVYSPKALENVAVGKPASLSSDYTGSLKGPASYGVDGNTDQNYNHESCFHTAQEIAPSFTVDLQGQYEISHVIVYNRQDCCASRAHDIVLKIGTDEASLSDPSNIHDSIPGVLPSQATLNARPGAVGRFVQVQIYDFTNAEYFHLCEVQVFGIPVLSNVALGKTTEQSSNYNGDALSGKAVDGNTNQNFNGGSCTHTQKETNPYWRVDLGSTHTIHEVIVYNRLDCCSSRARNLEVKMGDTVGSMQQVGYKNGQIDDIQVFRLLPTVDAQFVQLTILDTDYLHVCEVVVLGTPKTS